MPAFAFDASTRESVAIMQLWFQEKSRDNQKMVTEGEVLLSWGSCFFVGKDGENPQYLVTNYHVIQDYYESGAGEIGDYVISWTDAWGDSYESLVYGRAKMTRLIPLTLMKHTT